MSGTFTAGFGRADITPEKYGPLGGYGDDSRRICTNILDHTLGTCVAITGENGETILLFTADILKGSSEITTSLQEQLTEAIGIPQDHIVLSATHTHAAHSVVEPLEAVERYIRYLVRQLIKAAHEALEDRAPATIFAGKTIVERMTFVRHYLMNDGCYSGPNFGTKSRASGYKAHADKADEQLQLIRFARKNARDIVLVNWQSHATITGAFGGIKTDLSADYIGAMRDHFEGLSGCHFAYFQGACGNLVPSSQLEGEALIQDRSHILYGKKMAEFAMELMHSGMQPMKTGAVEARRYHFSAPVDHSDDCRMADAQYVRDRFFQISDKNEQSALLDKYGFNSVHHARGVLRRGNAPAALDMELNALRAGGISFATVPYEMFCSNGMYIKSNSPFDFTFMLTNSDGNKSYLPDANAFRYDCYEVNARLFYNGVAEEIADKLVDMLNDLHS